MSNDMKIMDYIPADKILCRRCEFYETCPEDYICPTIDRQLEFEHGEGNEE